MSEPVLLAAIGAVASIVLAWLDLRSKVGGGGELGQKLDALAVQVDARLDTVESQVGDVEEKVEHLNDRVGNIDGRLKKVEKQITKAVSDG